MLQHGDKTQDFSLQKTFLKILAHCWTGVLAIGEESLQRTDDSPDAANSEPVEDRSVPFEDWVAENWWTTQHSIEPFSSFSAAKKETYEIRVRTSDATAEEMQGCLKVDDVFQIPHAVSYTCIVLHSTVVKRKAESSTGKSGYGYYLLVAQELVDEPGTYQRVGIAQCISEHDRLPRFLGAHTAPTTALSLT